MSAAQYETRTDGRGKLVICTLNGETGAARVFTAGEEEARQRALAQAEAKVRARANR